MWQHGSVTDVSHLLQVCFVLKGRNGDGRVSAEHHSGGTMKSNEPLHEAIAYLQKHLGKKMTLYLSGLNDHFWPKRDKMPIEAEMRLRYAHRAALVVVSAYGAETAKSWLFGTNRHLKDNAPAWVLRHAKTIAELEKVVSAAKAFIIS